MDNRCFTGPHHSDGTPDMDSAEWNAYCCGQWWAAVQEDQLIEGLAARQLPPLLELDVEDLVHLIRRHAGGYRRHHPRGANDARPAAAIARAAGRRGRGAEG